MMLKQTRRVVAFTMGFVCGAAAHGQAFTPGDVYLVSRGFQNPSPPPSSIRAVVRYQPTAGWAHSITYIGDIEMRGVGAYEPMRDRLIVIRGVATDSMVFVDASGGAVLYNPGWTGQNVDLVAPTGDGRIYVHSVTSDRFAVIDAFGTIIDVLDAALAAPFVLASSSFPATDMIYDAGTNSLILVRGIFQVFDGFEVVRVSLSADGLSATGVETIVPNTATNAGGGVVCVGLSPGPGGSIFLKLDDNSGATAARMQLINPVTLAAQSFASSGYFGVGGEVAGVYLPSSGQAVVLDSLSDNLRSFSPGSSGAGTIVATGASSSGGSGERARLIHITDRAAAICLGDADGNGQVDFADITSVLSNWLNDYTPNTGPGDANFDGVVNFTDITTVLSNWLVVCP